MWQDIAFALLNVLLLVFLFPQIHDVIVKGKSLNLYTTGLTAVALFAIAIVDLTLDLWFTFCVTLITVVAWLVLFVYSMRNVEIDDALFVGDVNG